MFSGLGDNDFAMIVAFFESIKYVGHLLPISFLRVYMGYYYLNEALLKYNGDYLLNSAAAYEMSKWLPNSQAPIWYKSFLESYLVTNWQVFSYVVTSLEFLVGISFILGYLVRPFGLLAGFLCVNYVILSGPDQQVLYKTFLAINFTMAWLGAGRCLGVDYFFFKRRRGIWW